MKAAVFHKPKDIRVENVPDPRIEDPRDAIVRITLSAICGSDLHIYNGLIPQLHPLTLGHEFMGVVEDVGPEVHNLQRGDRVVVPFSIACGRCWFCERNFQTQCENSNKEKYGPEGGLLDQKGGGLFGYTDLYGGYKGGWAEAVRVPYADYGPRKVPEGLTDEQVIFTTDILVTGWTGLEWAEVQPGETVAVYGCGPVGLMAQKSAWLHGAERVIGVDVQDYRLETARRVANSETVNAKEGEPAEKIWDMTEGRGADVVVEAVGMEVDANPFQKVADLAQRQAGSTRAVESACKATRRSGRLSIMGVYATEYSNFPLGMIFDKGLRIQQGQSLPHVYMDRLLALIQDGKLRADDIITHRIGLDEVPKAIETFNDKEDGCVKVVIRP